MADRRAPGDVSDHTTKQLFYWDNTYPTASQGSYFGNTMYSRRPYYPKGQYITLPSGAKFRKGTSYEHESYELGAIPPYAIKGTATSGSGWRCDIKGTREIDVFTTTYFNLEARLASLSGSDGVREANTKALNNLADQKINVGEHLASISQTLRMIRDSSIPLLRLLNEAASDRSVRPFLFKSYQQIMREGVDRALARRYLEYVYGWKPLVNDIYKAFEIAKGASSHDLMLKAVGRASRSYARSTASAWRKTSYGWMKVHKASATQQCKTVLHARVNPAYAGIRTLNQYGLLNPLSLAWEMVPWSFVVDWFLPIGPVLNSWTAPAGLIFIDGSTSVRTTQDTTFEYALGYHYDDPTIRVAEVSKSVFPHKYEGYWRQTLSNFPRPLPWIDLDPFKGDRSLKALALGLVALGGRKTRLSRLG